MKSVIKEKKREGKGGQAKKDIKGDRLIMLVLTSKAITTVVKLSSLDIAKKELRIKIAEPSEKSIDLVYLKLYCYSLSRYGV